MTDEEKELLERALDPGKEDWGEFLKSRAKVLLQRFGKKSPEWKQQVTEAYKRYASASSEYHTMLEKIEGELGWDIREQISDVLQAGGELP